MSPPKSYRYRLLRDVIFITILLLAVVLLPRASRAGLRVTVSTGALRATVVHASPPPSHMVSTAAPRVWRVTPQAHRTMLVSRPVACSHPQRVVVRPAHDHRPCRVWIPSRWVVSCDGRALWRPGHWQWVRR
jgi:hypothetical protein